MSPAESSETGCSVRKMDEGAENDVKKIMLILNAKKGNNIRINEKLKDDTFSVDFIKKCMMWQCNVILCN